ncbi:MAG: preprotein translocase subunit YajC [Phycisphaerales bacterium JB043]
MDYLLDVNSGFVLIGQAASGPPTATQGGDGTTLQPGSQPLGTDGQPTQPVSPMGGLFFPLLIGMFLLMIVMSVFSGRKQKRQRAELLSSLGKHDKVQTVGGVIGTIVELKDSEIVLKVDEATNTKIRFARSSVQTVIKPAGQRTESSAVQEPEMVASA